ncbi:hypothetical protein E4H04_13040, partial [Candidatus Bathyarchaeota archaeon]
MSLLILEFSYAEKIRQYYEKIRKIPNFGRIFGGVFLILILLLSLGMIQQDVELGGIDGYVFNDFDRNGAIGVNESRIEGCIVQLY